MSVVEDKCFKELHRFCTHLAQPLRPNGITLDTDDDDKICHALGNKHYTYLTVIGDCVHEVIRVCSVSGSLYVDRAIDETCMGDWPCGTEVSFEWNPSAIADQMRKADELIPEEPECDEPYSGQFCMGRFNFIVRKGLIVDCKPNGRNIANDEFINPVVQFDKNGCIECVTEGPDKFLQYREPCK